MHDPFTLVYDALWDLAEASVAVTSLVRVGNRVKLDSVAPTAGLKKEVSQADLPEIVLALTSSTGNIRGTSSSSSVIRQYQWALSTGDMDPRTLLALEFALYAALADWPTVLSTLTWQGLGFVKRANIVSAEHGESDPERNRGVRGWSGLWTLDVEMHFRTGDLVDYGFQTGT